MVRIEMKKIAEGQVMLAIEAKKETPDEVLTCAARGLSLIHISEPTRPY